MKILSVLLMLSILLFADEGKALFHKHCSTCHQDFISLSKLKANFLDENNSLNLKAPTLNQLSYRLKQRVGDRHGDPDLHRLEVTAFMSDYVYNPDKDKSLCLDEVMAFFQTMPSLKGKVSEEELEEIGNYLYDFDKAVKKTKLKTKIKQYKGFAQVLKEAKKGHKIIIIEAQSKYCTFCRKMEKEVLGEEDIISILAKDFIFLSIDVSTQHLPLGLKVSMTPSFIFLDENTKLLTKIAGAWAKEDFKTLLQEIKNKKDSP